MKKTSAIGAAYRHLILGLFVALFAAGCSKHEDDCSAPDQEEPATSTRAQAAGDDVEESRPAGVSYRNGETGGEDIDGDGINDDGDDEADGEGNKKNRPQN